MSASYCGTGGGVFGAEVVQAAEALDAEALLACEPAEDVHIVAALGEDHGAGLVGAAPVAANEAVGVVPIADVFHVVN